VNTSSKHPKLGILRFNHPDKYNAMSVDMGREFREAVRNIIVSNDLECLILTGNGKAFSAGGDLGFLKDRKDASPEENSNIMLKYYSRFMVVRGLGIPTIAAINGPAVGAGACVSLLTDIRIASESALFGFNFVKIGIHPGMGVTHFLQRLVGQAVANRMLLTGELISAKQALAFGAVSEVVPDASDIVERAEEIGVAICNNSHLATRQTVKTLRQSMNEGLAQALQREADSQALCYAHQDLYDALANLAARKK